MPLQRKMARAKRSKPTKMINCRADEVHLVCDALFVGVDDEEYLGNVIVVASPEGRKAVEALFPETDGRTVDIDWYEPKDGFAGRFPSDWKQFCLQVRGMLEDGFPLKVPQHLLDIKPLSELNSDHFGCLLAMGAMHEGIRVAHYTASQGLAIYTGPESPKVH